MSWKPTVLHPEKNYMHEQYGITELRRRELSDAMEREFKVAGPTVVSLTHHVQVIAELAKTPNEYAFALVLHMMYLAKKNAFL